MPFDLGETAARAAPRLAAVAPKEAPGDPGAAAGPHALRALELLLVFVVAGVVLVVSSLGFGLTFDEVTYFRYADSIRAWWHAGAPLDAAALDRYWGYDPYTNAHPPWMKILAAVGSPWASRWLPFPTDYRFAHFVWIAACLTGAYALLRQCWSALAATLALAFVTLQPQVFGQLLIAANDSPVALAFLLLALLAWQLDEEPPAQRRRLLWAAFFVVAAWAAATKFTGWLAPLPMGAFFLWRRRWRAAVMVAAASLSALGFMVLVTPNLWQRPLGGAVAYLLYPLSRVAMPFSTAYLGHVYRGDLPWHYFALMSAVTMPPLLLVLLPAAGLAKGSLRRLLVPVGFAIGFWLVLVHLPGTPRHDGVRQFVSVYPLLGTWAWAGLLAIQARFAPIQGSLARRGAVAVGGLATLAVLAWTVARAHPFELSYYNRLIGGVQGAERAGMELSLYFEAVDRGVLAAMDRNLRPGETLFMAPYWPGLLQAYADHGILRVPIQLLPQYSRQRPDWLLLVRRRYYLPDSFFVRLPAVYEVRYDGVPLVKLVRLPAAGRPQELGEQARGRPLRSDP